MPAAPAAERGPVGAGVPASPSGAEQGREAPEPWGPPPAGLDVSAPHPARVRNYWLGGRDFFAADKAAAEEIGRDFPHLPETARAERAFLVRAVRFLAGGQDPAVPRRRPACPPAATPTRSRSASRRRARSFTPTTTRRSCCRPRRCSATRCWPARPTGRSATPTPTCATWPRCWPRRAARSGFPAGRADHAGHPRARGRLRRGPVDHQPAGGRAARGQLPGDRRRPGGEPGHHRRAAAVRRERQAAVRHQRADAVRAAPGRTS